jgi:uncharacterized membrane protein
MKEVKKQSSMNQEVKKIKEEVKKTIDEFKPFYGYKQTFGQKAADFLTKWAGSWAFIFFFFIFLGLWMSANIYAWIQEWDPYPFILLNLVLSCLAAIQAPVILMSQNRSAQRDRLRAENDYKVNRKSEKEIGIMQKQLNRIEKKLFS